ncbi:MAG: hypothetical protein FJY85_05990 [Deltaproteobacteria bacterium]|nr:hypothetical protein [Deltaproteobacteria bacterium]
MAKLKEMVTPEELLELVLGGALKNEVIKKYKTSDQELAMMLLPLYRNGDLSKEEFNDFFKGVPVKPREHGVAPLPETASPPGTEVEAPSQILRSLETAGEPGGPQAEALPEDDLDIDVSPTEEPVAEPGLRGRRERLAPHEAAEHYERFQPQAIPPGLQPEDAANARPKFGSGDSAVTPQALDMIFAKLNSIDARLAKIEKKLNLV